MVGDVLGGDWSEAAVRRAPVHKAIAEWQPDNNTFPSLSAPPIQVVGWAALARAGTFDDAIE